MIPKSLPSDLIRGWEPVSRLREARFGGRRKVEKDHALGKMAPPACANNAPQTMRLVSMTQRSFVCARGIRERSGWTQARCEGNMTATRQSSVRNAHIVEVVGGLSLTAFAPALSSPLRKRAPNGRPVHRLGDRAGRSPGSRVVAQLRPAFPVSQWPFDAGSPLTVAGAATGRREFVNDERQVGIRSIRIPSFVPGFARGTSTVKMFA
jgi:hypothetical protein